MLKAADLGQRWKKGVSREPALKPLLQQPRPVNTVGPGYNWTPREDANRRAVKGQSDDSYIRRHRTPALDEALADKEKQDIYEGIQRLIARRLATERLKQESRQRVCST